MTVLKYQIRQIIFHAGRKLPGRKHPEKFGTYALALSAARQNYDDFSISWACQCDEYRRKLAEMLETRPVKIKEFTSLFAEAALTWIESNVTDGAGYHRYFADFKSKYFPDASTWPKS